MERSEGESSKKEYFDELTESCEAIGTTFVWLGTDTFVLVAGVPANAALLWLFLGEKKSLSAAKVLGLNLVVMDFIFLSLMPFSLIFYEEPRAGRNTSASAASPAFTGLIRDVSDVFDMFNLIGCPLLLTCMCVERYLAVMRPVLYLRLRKWEYKAAVCAAVWAVTFAFIVMTARLQEASVMNTAVSVLISCLFMIMLGCLGTIMWSLRRQSPAREPRGGRGRNESPQKRQAVKNLLGVVVPAVTAYLPVLLMLPIVIYIYSSTKETDKVLCYLFEVSQLSPRLGVFIGPLFYLSKAKQLCCLSRT